MVPTVRRVPAAVPAGVAEQGIQTGKQKRARPRRKRDQRSRVRHEAAVLTGPGKARACTATEVELTSRQNAAAKLGRQIARRVDLPQAAAAGGRMPGQRESLARFPIHPAPQPPSATLDSPAGRAGRDPWLDLCQHRTYCGFFRGFFWLSR